MTLNCNKCNIFVIYKTTASSFLKCKIKKHLPHIDKYTKNILDNTSNENRTYISNELEKLSDELLSYSSYFMDKYYKYDFRDCLKLILSNLGGE